MKLDELLGAKSAMNAVRRDYEDNDAPDPITSYLHSIGFSSISRNASYAKVYEHPNYDYVLKVFAADDVGYQAFLDLCRRFSGNPHIPRFIGRPVDLSNRVGLPVMAIRMERLEPMDFGRIEVLYRLVDAIRDIWGMQEDYFQDSFQNRVEPELIHMLFVVVRDAMYADSYRLDLHVGNYMLRGDTVVITDPFAPYNVLDRKLPELF